MNHKQITGLVVIADDLTGALDATAPFRGSGLSVTVATAPDAFAEALARGASVTAVSTRSREVPGAEAAARVRAALALVDPGRPVLKKVDSRMKGPVAAELAALPDRPLLVAPAIPAFGRVVRQGRVEGFGVATPIEIAPLLGARAADALIPDTETEAAMDAALAAAPEGAILVGARGLCAAMARRAGIRPAPAPSLRGRVAIAVGSTDPITLAQVARLRETARLLAPSGQWEGSVPAGDAVLLQAVPGPETDGAAIARALAASFRPLAAGADSLILTGGATAEAVLDALEVTVLDLVGEVLPGLPLSLGAGWRIVTKSGGFGTAGTLADLVEGSRAEVR